MIKMNLIQRMQRGIVECWRVFKRTKKPTSEEFKTIIKIAALGVLLIGLLGFIVAIIKMYVTKMF